MGVLSKEIENVQNPALGAMALWRFAIGYSGGSGVSSPVPLPLLFIALPMLLHQETAALVSSTRAKSGLRALVAKFGESKTSKNDLMLYVHDRSLKMRDLSIESIRLAVACRLLAIDTAEASVIPLSETPPEAGVGKSVRVVLRDAQKLGLWCSQVSLYEVSSILKVSF